MATHRADYAPRPGSFRPFQPVDRRAVRGRDPPRGGPRRGRRPARRPDRQAHRSLAAGQVHRRRAGQPRQDLVGSRSTGRSRRRDYDRLRSRLTGYLAGRDLYSQDCFIGAAAAHRRSLRVYTETAWASIFARNLFRRPSRAAAGRLRAQLHDHLRPVVPGGSRTRRDPHRHRDPRPPRADGDHHRRDRIRRRDQEERLHGHELPHARRRRAADARGHQRRPGRRPGGLLRAVGHGQDDPVGRPAAQPHRRRRARLGRRHRVQLRGRLLRQDDPPVADVRAGHLPDHPALRDDPRERRSRPADPRARPRFGAVHREHARRLPARLHRQRRRDRCRRARPGRSCS